MKIPVYRIDASAEKLNELGKDERWQVTNQNPPIIAAKFRMNHPDAELVKPMFDKAVQAKEARKAIQKLGFKVSKKDDGYAITDWEPLYDWSLEFCLFDEDRLLYVCPTKPEINVPPLASKSAIDKYVPEDLLQSILNSGVAYADEMEQEDLTGEDSNPEPSDKAKPKRNNKA